MSTHNITVASGSSVRLKTAGKYCDSDIIVNAKFKYSNSNATSIGTKAFYGMQDLEVDAPAVTSLGANAFSRSGIKRVEFPNLTSAGGDCFSYCYSLTYADLGIIDKVPSWCFANCLKLVTLILRKTGSITTLNNNGLGGATAMLNGTGYIYVPSTLIDTYKTATDWTEFANQFRALEDYTVDGTITGELDESKI